MKKWRIIARHKWIPKTVLTESYLIEDDNFRRFTATIDGFRNFKIYEGRSTDVEKIKRKLESVKKEFLSK